MSKPLTAKRAKRMTPEKLNERLAKELAALNAGGLMSAWSRQVFEAAPAPQPKPKKRKLSKESKQVRSVIVESIVGRVGEGNRARVTKAVDAQLAARDQRASLTSEDVAKMTEPQWEALKADRFAGRSGTSAGYATFSGDPVRTFLDNWGA